MRCAPRRVLLHLGLGHLPVTGLPDDIQPIPRCTADELLGTDETPEAEWSEFDGSLGIAHGLGTSGLWLWGE